MKNNGKVGFEILQRNIEIFQIRELWPGHTTVSVGLVTFVQAWSHLSKHEHICPGLVWFVQGWSDFSIAYKNGPQLKKLCMYIKGIYMI